MQLQPLEQLLGEDVFFVPCQWGTKKPLVTYVERPFEGTQSPAYREVFDAQPVNIAVYLGKASGGLCAIDFDNDSDLERFLELNPALADTTRSRGSRGGMIWLRIAGDYPPSCNPEHKHFEWRADGRLSTIAGRHPRGMDYTIPVAQPPAVCAFADIAWPGDWELPWLKQAQQEALAALERDYGRSLYTGRDGRVTGINERFWAGLYAREHDVLHDPEEKTFYEYDHADGLWKGASPENIREKLSARILEASRETRETGLELFITNNRLNPVVSMLKGIAEKRDAFRAKGRFVHVSNGVIQLADTGEASLTSFAPDYYSRNRSPLRFDPEARCPRFLNELIYPAVSEDDASLLQRWAGLALFGDNLPQRLLILDGTPNGGKGTFARIIQHLVGVENTCQLRTECLNERFETYRYRGKTLLMGPDVRGSFLMERGASTLKMLVGGDPITAEGKGLNNTFPMFGSFNVLITCNSRLRVRLEGDEGAWRRRLLIVRYEKPPPRTRILDFHDKLLKEEGSGILNWALEGLAQLWHEFRQQGDFVLSGAQQRRIDALLEESESLRVFLKERVRSNQYSDVTTSEITQTYAEFCAERGWNPLPVTTVERQLPDLMLEFFHVNKAHDISRDGKSQRGFRRVKLCDGGGLNLQ